MGAESVVQGQLSFDDFRGSPRKDFEDGALSGAGCGRDDFRLRITCVDVNEYFGSLLRAGLTLLQVVTLDHWASHIARPLFEAKPAAGYLLIAFAILTAYCLMSAAVGVLVFSTVDQAAEHHGHASRQDVVRDRELQDSPGLLPREP